MSNLANKPPLGLKDRSEKPPKPRKRVNPISDKRRAYRASQEGQEDLEHMGIVITEPCAACGRVDRPRDAHHCRDLPPFHLRHIYHRLPGARLRSADTDTIPLCKGEGNCHWQFHNRRSEFHQQYGCDYLYILPTRARVAAALGEIDY